jgi:tyrosine-protein phosphatase non-receptor type 23
LSFAAEGLSQHAQQRNPKRPVVVHCHSGVGRSGVYILLSAAIAEIRAGNGLPDILTIATNISHQRRGPLRDRQHLLFAFQALLYHCQDLLMKRNCSNILLSSHFSLKFLYRRWNFDNLFIF